MDNTRKREKQIAKIFKKIAKGKATTEEVISFLELSYELSSFASVIKNKPKIETSIELKREDDTIVRGEYSSISSKIFLNTVCIEQAKRNKLGALAFLLNTYGHELTHHIQQERGYVERQIPFSAEQIKDALEFTGFKGDDAIYDKVAYSYYLQKEEEVMAREGGRIFCEECIDLLKENKYIKNKYKDMINTQLEEYKELSNLEKETIQIQQKIYDSIKNYFSFVDISYFVDKEKEPHDKEKFIYSLNFKIELMEPIDICKSFYRLLSENNSRTKINLYYTIKKINFPHEEKIYLKNKILKSILKEDENNVCYNNQLYGILNDDDYETIYKNALINNVQKVESPLFDDFLLQSYDSGLLILAKTLVKTYEEGLLNINSKETKEVLSRHISRLLNSDYDILPSNVRNELVKLGEELQSKGAKKVKSNIVR